MNLGELRKTKDGYEATFERVLDQPPEKVWKALTDPEEIEAWFVRTELEARVGGRYVEHHDHVGMSMEGEVTHWDPPRAFGHTWWADPDGGYQEASILWEITPEGAGSRLIMTHRFKDLEGADGIMAGWHICIDILEAILDGDAPDDHAPPQGEFADGQFTATTPGKGHWSKREELEGTYARRLEKGPTGSVEES